MQSLCFHRPYDSLLQPGRTRHACQSMGPKGAWSYVDAVVNLQGVWRSSITTTNDADDIGRVEPAKAIGPRNDIALACRRIGFPHTRQTVQSSQVRLGHLAPSPTNQTALWSAALIPGPKGP